MKRIAIMLIVLAAGLMVTVGCSRKPAGSAGGGRAVTLVLNWVAEPEFGGFYAARGNGAFAKHGLDVTIQSGGAGTPALDMVAAGHADFAIASADEVLIARSRGMDVVAIYAVYQTCPQGIMAHEEAGYDSLASLFAEPPEGKRLTLAMELGLPYVRFLQNKYGFEHMKAVPFAGGIAQFMADSMVAQQCFITSEPISVKRQGGKPKVFLIAESGYNPYTTVVVARGELLRKDPAKVRAFVDAIAEGWSAYLHDPAAANQMMHELNTTMDLATFAAAAEAQKPLIEQPEPSDQCGCVVGGMTVERWQTLRDQLISLGVIDKEHAPKAEECFVDMAEKKSPNTNDE
ncbi:MAG: ABC transporter substrate-binding protein [Phycisphaerales bacterium]